MRVDGMEATYNGYSGKPEDSQTQVRPEARTNTSVNGEVQISEKDVYNAIENANKAISHSNRKFEYSIHKETKEIMVKVIDSETNEVISEIPPEKILDMVAKMWEMAGLIVDEKR